LALQEPVDVLEGRRPGSVGRCEVAMDVDDHLRPSTVLGLRPDCQASWRGVGFVTTCLYPRALWTISSRACAISPCWRRAASRAECSWFSSSSCGRRTG